MLIANKQNLREEYLEILKNYHYKQSVPRLHIRVRISTLYFPYSQKFDTFNEMFCM
nr:MAG TPA: hypothetical protein [Inoviridae sp.]